MTAASTPPENDPLLPRTEALRPEHAALDRYSTPDLVRAFVDDQQAAVAAVAAVADDLARAVDAAVPRLAAGGRLIYVGAGTSGRLGVLDSVELPPTFDWPAERARGVLAGGAEAMFVAVEGAEDNAAQGAADLAALAPGLHDVVLLIAASGATPFVLGALQAARAAGALTIGLANNAGAPVATGADHGLVLDTGPEVISGSTRLKAGTAQKIALNTFSSSVMVRLNKVYGQLMVDVRATNAKLQRRALRLTRLATGVDEATARAALEAAAQRVKVAVVMIQVGVDAAEAGRRLAESAGSVHAAVAGSPARQP